MIDSSRYALTVFHAYGHKFDCQVKFNPRFIEGFGFTDGEGMERLWSYLSGFIKQTRNMSKENRKLTLLLGVRYFTNAKNKNFGISLVREQITYFFTNKYFRFFFEKEMGREPS